MYHVMIAGAGKIGSLLACLLAASGDYQIYLVDKVFTGADVLRLKQQFPQIHTVVLDVQDRIALLSAVKKYPLQAIVSSLPYFCNPTVAAVARESGLHYFDLTEDVTVTTVVSELAKNANTAFVPQCGLAPGFVNIVAHSLMQHFESLDTVKLRVGALPQQASNGLNYALTWSTDGVINEYGNLCHVIENDQDMLVPALEGLEAFMLDGQEYEAFNTSGGLASLAKTYIGKVKHLTYKTLRYPGHCAKIKFLMNDLRLNDDRATLKRILENAIPKTYQDMVLIYVSVMGRQQQQLLEESYVKKIYPAQIAGLTWSAIQITTAAGVATAVDQVLSKPDQYKGLILQEHFLLTDVLHNRFGQYYR